MLVPYGTTVLNTQSPTLPLEDSRYNWCQRCFKGRTHAKSATVDMLDEKKTYWRKAKNQRITEVTFKAKTLVQVFQLEQRIKRGYKVFKRKPLYIEHEPCTCIYKCVSTLQTCAQSVQELFYHVLAGFAALYSTLHLKPTVQAQNLTGSHTAEVLRITTGRKVKEPDKQSLRQGG